MQDAGNSPSRRCLWSLDLPMKHVQLLPFPAISRMAIGPSKLSRWVDDRDRGMAFFLAFLALTVIVVPMVTLSRAGRMGLGFMFACTLISGAVATIHSRYLTPLVAGLTVTAVAVDVLAEFVPSQGSLVLDTVLKLICLSIMVSM